MNRTAVVEFANSISEEDMRVLTLKLSERYSGDLAEALEFMSNHKQMDAMLSNTHSADELYDLCDQIRDVLQRECRKRGVVLYQGAAA